MAVRKKASTRKTTGKSTTRKKTTRKKPARKKVARRKTTRGTSALKRLENELPKNLRDYTHRLRLLLTRVEKEIGNANSQARGRLARLLREASQMLGRVEALGPARWRSLTSPYRREAQRLMRRLEKAVVPASKKKTAARRKPRRRPSHAAGPFVE